MLPKRSVAKINTKEKRIEKALSADCLLVQGHHFGLFNMDQKSPPTQNQKTNKKEMLCECKSLKYECFNKTCRDYDWSQSFQTVLRAKHINWDQTDVRGSLRKR